MNRDRIGGSLTLALVAFRNIRRNGRRTALCVVAVAIAVLFIIFMEGWITGMLGSMEDVVRTYDAAHVNVVTDEYESRKEYLPVQYPVTGPDGLGPLAARLRAIPGVKAVLPRITAYATLFDSKVKHAFLWGIDIAAETKINTFNLTKRTDGLIAGRYPAAGANECAVGTGLARRTGLTIGDRIPLKSVSAQFSDKYYGPEITGIFEFDFRRFDDDFIIVPFERLQRILVLGDGTQQLVIYVSDPERAGHVKADVARELGRGFTVREWKDNYWVAMFSQMSFMFFVVYAVFLVVASFLIINTVLMVIHERIKEIGMMGALGLTRGEIVRVFFLEAVFLSVLGAAIGSLAGGTLTFVCSLFPLDLDLFTGGGMKDMPMSGTLFIAFSPLSVLKGFLLGVAISSACTILPSLKSAFIGPVEALRR